MSKPSLSQVRASNANLAQCRPLTAVFTGGTSGIGEYTIRALARHYGESKQALHIYIVGRNRKAADAIASECQAICPHIEIEFVQAGDLSLLKDVDAASAEIARRQKERDGKLSAIDLLFMSHADLWFGGQTQEGLDKSMSLLYYSRMRFTTNLLPLLRNAEQPARVISVFGAGLEKPTADIVEDLSLRQAGNYNMTQYRNHVVSMKTIFFEHLASDAENKGKVSFLHVFPGLVITPAFVNDSHPWWFKAIWPVVKPVMKLTVAVPPEENGERMLYLASSRAYSPKGVKADGDGAAMSTHGVRGDGAYACGQTGGYLGVSRKYTEVRKQGRDKLVVEHTMAAFEAVEDGRKFEG